MCYFRYPQALYLLELLQYEHFRKELMNSQCAKFIDDQQLLHWQHYQKKRVKLLSQQAEKVASTGAKTQQNSSSTTVVTTTTTNTSSSTGAQPSNVHLSQAQSNVKPSL